MSLYDKIRVTSPDDETEYEEGTDYIIDYLNNTITRIDGGGIPDGGDVRVTYKLGVDGGLLSELKASGTAVMNPVKAKLVILNSPNSDFHQSGTDISDEVTHVELIQDLSKGADKLRFKIADSSRYTDFDPDDDVIVVIAFGEETAVPGENMVECFRGLVVERELINAGDGSLELGITARDFSIALDSPNQPPMGRIWHPVLRREVFLNGNIIADDYRDLRNSTIYTTLDIDDVVEIHFARENPRAHQIIHDCFNAASSEYFDHVVIDCLDFPVVFMDGKNKTPLDIIREIASVAGATVKAEGNSLVISERGFPGSFETTWVYDTAVIYDQEETDRNGEFFNAIQIFGHSETSRLPTKSVYIPPTDFTMPGWSRVVDVVGTLEPEDPIRSDELPQPAELHFQIDGELYDASMVHVLGGELADAPDVEFVDGKKVINVAVNIDWVVDDKAGEPPYVEDEFGNKLFRIKGRVYDAIPDADGENPPIGLAKVTREKLDGENAGDKFELNSDEDGYYIFENVEIGNYKIIAEASGYLGNFDDTDPDNDEYRDLYQELIDYESEIDKGRYEKQPTDYHVIVWARPLIDPGPLADLTVSMVILEARDESTLSGSPLSYGNTIRDERITTEILARRIGKILIDTVGAINPSFTIKTPLNRWIKAGDGIRLTGDEIDNPLPSSENFQATSIRKIFDPSTGSAHDFISCDPGSIGNYLAGKLREDPLDTHVGTVVAVYRNELYGRVYDVSASGTTYYSLKSGPLLGALKVGEIVQIAKAKSGALGFYIVARTTEIFPEGRIVYV